MLNQIKLILRVSFFKKGKEENKPNTVIQLYQTISVYITDTSLIHNDMPIDTTTYHPRGMAVYLCVRQAV